MTPEDIKQLEADLWHSADTLRSNSDLKASEYSTPVLGLIFLKFADNKYRRYETEIQAEYEALKGTRREKALPEIAILKCGFYLPDHARYHYLLNLPESEDIDKALYEAMQAIEQHMPELAGVLPKDEYYRLTRTDKTLPKRLLENFADIPPDADGDLFGQIYEYFLGNFALKEGQGGGEFFTPRSVVRLMVEVIEPHRGTVYDPACGSGGMFVQSQKFIEQHRAELPYAMPEDLYVKGQEKTSETVKLAKMNLVVNGLRGEIQQTNTYYDDPFDSFESFDYVLANPPFNVDEVNLNKVKGQARFNTYGIPQKKTKVKKDNEGKQTVPNANYLWINLFATSLKMGGRAALVMANSASDARHTEAEIRQNLIEAGLIDGMLTLPSNMFYTVTLPATLWFFHKSTDKPDEQILFIDARNIFVQIDRAHRMFSEEQISNLAVIHALRRGQCERFTQLVDRYFAQGMEKLGDNAEQVKPVSAQLLEVLSEGQAVVKAFEARWAGWETLRESYQAYLDTAVQDVDAQNGAQHALYQSFAPFFQGLHDGLKQLDKIVREHEKAQTAQNGGKRRAADKQTKDLKATLETLHAEVNNAEVFFKHIHWLQERFPAARYEDVTGLCKLARLDEIKEQDYSLNPGRYVGVVIEEDGKTEEEFIADLLAWQDELAALNAEAQALEAVIAGNVREIVS